MDNDVSQEHIDNLRSEQTRLCYERLGWSTAQWDSPLELLEKVEEDLLEQQAETDNVINLLSRLRTT